MWDSSPQGYPGVLTTGKLAFPRSEDQETKVEVAMHFLTFALEITCYHFCSDAFITQVSPHRMWKDHTGARIIEGKDHWGCLFQASPGLHTLRDAH